MKEDVPSRCPLSFGRGFACAHLRDGVHVWPKTPFRSYRDYRHLLSGFGFLAMHIMRETVKGTGLIPIEYNLDHGSRKWSDGSAHENAYGVDVSSWPYV